MLLIAVLLGAAFAWIVEILWREFRGRNAQRGDAYFDGLRTNAINAAVLLIFMVVCGVFVIGIYDRFLSGDWSSQYVIALHYLTAPSVQGVVVTFLAAALVVWARDRLRELFARLTRYLFALPQAPRNAPARTRRPAARTRRTGREAEGPAEERPREPYPWLAGIVGIAAVTLVAVVTLVVFFPDILQRVESIKVAGVEARFAAAASRTVQLASQNEEATKTDRGILGLADFDKDLILSAAQARVSGQDPNLAGTEGYRFVRDLAAPLARVIGCYSKDFRIRDTQMQDEAARAANQWRHVFKDKDQVQSTDSRLDAAIKSTQALFTRLQSDLSDRKPSCYNAAASLSFSVTPQNLQYVRQNGFAVSFVALFLLLTHEPSHAEAFIEDMAPHLDTSPATLTAQLAFYYNRSEIRSITRSPADEIDADLSHAQLLADRLIACIRDSKAIGCRDFGKSVNEPPHPGERNLEKIAEYYDLLRISIINNRLYSLIGDWLGGRRLDPSDLLKLEGTSAGGLAYELAEWMKRHSLSMLRDRKDETALISVQAFAAISDTLAVREIVIGASKNDFSKERCARIPGQLAVANRIYRDTKGKDDMRIVSQHRNLYESACAQQ